MRLNVYQVPYRRSISLQFDGSSKANRLFGEKCSRSLSGGFEIPLFDQLAGKLGDS